MSSFPIRFGPLESVRCQPNSVSERGLQLVTLALDVLTRCEELIDFLSPDRDCSASITIHKDPVRHEMLMSTLSKFELCRLYSEREPPEIELNESISINSVLFALAMSFPRWEEQQRGELAMFHIVTRSSLGYFRTLSA
uniref:NR LBD domain-containing protein n=1 Tax=Globodera pallida TaxID=36090 RepID=A0A183CF33_GLOPA